MTAGSFEKNGIGWQLGQLQRRIGEWLELKFSQTLPNGSLPSWLDSPLVKQIARIAFWVIVGLLVAWAVWQIWRLLRPYFYTLTNPLGQLDNKATKPSASELSIAAWLQKAQKFQQQGNYHEACLCLYQAMLQRLNDKELAPHQPSRTDGEYLQLVQQFPQPKPYQVLLATHQRLCFSNAEATRSLFDQCQQAYREIEAL